jgi:hypothetical protein
LLRQERAAMRNPFRFFIELMQQPLWVAIWVFFLMLINIASVGFWSEPLAKVIFVTFMFSAMLMMGLYSRFGFEKILGLGHVLWIPLIIYLLIEIPGTRDMFKSYLIMLSISIFISLVLDIVDVYKYINSRKSDP